MGLPSVRAMRVGMGLPLRRPSADTAVIVATALAGLRAIYRPGFKLAKAGVMLLNLQPDTVQQGELDLQEDAVQNRGRLMTAPDGLNQRHGRGTVLMASAGLAGDRRAWAMKQERRTPGYQRAGIICRRCGLEPH